MTLKKILNSGLYFLFYAIWFYCYWFYPDLKKNSISKKKKKEIMTLLREGKKTNPCIKKYLILLTFLLYLWFGPCIFFFLNLLENVLSY